MAKSLLQQNKVSLYNTPLPLEGRKKKYSPQKKQNKEKKKTQQKTNPCTVRLNI